MRWRGQAFASAVVLGVLLQVAPAAAVRASRPSAIFVVPPELRAPVDFWKNVFATWSRRHVAIHDTRHLDRVYTVLDFSDDAYDGQDQLVSQSVDEEIDRVRDLLIRLHQYGGAFDGMNADEQRIARLFAKDRSETKFLDAAASDRIRSQTGLKERFAAGIEIGHRYFPEMEAIFAAERVPIELTRLPLVESCFNVRAYSKVGAAGIWQFMPATGRRFMRVDSLVDERRDPIRSTRAAARFLRENYDKLGAWPLALTAYNHGPAGVARAVREVGTTDIVRIIREYDGPAFKFASRNFYPEFLAAIDVERNHRKHFGELALMEPIDTYDVPLSHPIELRTAAGYAGVDRDVLADLNPSLSSMIGDGRRSIPAGYRLRIPEDARQQFGVQYRQYASVYDSRPRTSVSRGGKKRGASAKKGKSKARRSVAKGSKRGAQKSSVARKNTAKSKRSGKRPCKGRCGDLLLRFAPDEVGPHT